MPQNTEEAIGQRLDENIEGVERLKSGDPSALSELLEECTGAIVTTVDVKTLA